ncbi:MAG: F0F1 ATP synthase subunit B [Candidatus Nomurabacteria bacterium]|jgi:F-type H+-transporting ATPase subunit b|nr:F0F1 ATP synthase subunit B [Candidatus Nomurabacteria bacterium]
MGLTNFAAAESSGLFGALGIDWKLLILQIIAFVILVVILAKFVYPPIAAMLDRRDKLIEDSVKSAKDADARAKKAAADVEAELKQARDEAADIVASARSQSQQMLTDAEKEAQLRADNTVEAARQQLARDVEAARQTLRDETAGLVAAATGKVVGHTITASRDENLIKEAIKKAEQERK